MMKKKKAFIIGVTGQDGSYLTKLLIKKNYFVYGYTRSLNKKNLKNLNILDTLRKIKLRKYSDKKPNIIFKDILRIKPSEIYFFQDNHLLITLLKNRLKPIKAISIFFLIF